MSWLEEKKVWSEFLGQANNDEKHIAKEVLALGVFNADNDYGGEFVPNLAEPRITLARDLLFPFNQPAVRYLRRRLYGKYFFSDR